MDDQKLYVSSAHTTLLEEAYLCRYKEFDAEGSIGWDNFFRAFNYTSTHSCLFPYLPRVYHMPLSVRTNTNHRLAYILANFPRSYLDDV